MHSYKFLLSILRCIDFNDELPFGGFIIDFYSKYVFYLRYPGLLISENRCTFTLMSFSTVYHQEQCGFKRNLGTYSELYIMKSHLK